MKYLVRMFVHYFTHAQVIGLVLGQLLTIRDVADGKTRLESNYLILQKPTEGVERNWVHRLGENPRQAIRVRVVIRYVIAVTRSGPIWSSQQLPVVALIPEIIPCVSKSLSDLALLNQILSNRVVKEDNIRERATAVALNPLAIQRRITQVCHGGNH